MLYGFNIHTIEFCCCWQRQHKKRVVVFVVWFRVHILCILCLYSIYISVYTQQLQQNIYIKQQKIIIILLSYTILAPLIFTKIILLLLLLYNERTKQQYYFFFVFFYTTFPVLLLLFHIYFFFIKSIEFSVKSVVESEQKFI